MSQSRRFNIAGHINREWAKDAVDIILKDAPEGVVTTAAGISPSGTVHFGNFRDVMTAHMIRNELISRGREARLVFSWDNFDRFRKVPVGVPESFEEHIGKPLSAVPDPQGEFDSYAARYQSEFVEAMEKLGIHIEYRDQTEMYRSGVYDEAIVHALQHRDKIAEIVVSFMTDKAIAAKGIDVEQYKEEYYPISVYSKFTDKDATKILSYDGDSTITYLCKITKQEDTINIREDRRVKLNWKPDWAMRWKHEGVVFEPGGPDHASTGGSYDAGSVMAREVFDYTPPVFVAYSFVGIQGLGAKMSGSKGNAVSPLQLLSIYEPELLKWLYERKAPNQQFELAFNSEIYRQYDEFDREHDMIGPSFRQCVGFGQIVGWDADKFTEILDQSELPYDKAVVERRLPLARNWLEKYNAEEMISFNQSVNTEYLSELPEYRKDQLAAFRSEFESMDNPTITDLETLSYKVAKREEYDEKQLKTEQRTFFKDIYNMLISKDRGPRLGTFLWASDREVIIDLLTF